jgi:hypothetical protein
MEKLWQISYLSQVIILSATGLDTETVEVNKQSKCLLKNDRNIKHNCRIPL